MLRHAVTGETGSVLSGRTPGIGLSEPGIAMAGAAAERLTDIKIHAIYTSPVQRCRETAAIVARDRGISPRILRGVQEVDYGDWTGRKLASLRRLKAWNGLFISPSRFRFPNGESLGEMEARAVAAIETLADRHGKETVLVTSHADVIRALIGHYLGMGLDLFQRLDVLPASVSVIDLPRRGFPRVPVVNDVGDPQRWR
jgi:probable phosphoglycerate mutase